ncbi:MAG: DHH family phosphoesterase [Firmicutes bacterium]|nr:DHH family phosphoesterase [Bacillota bacterium]
MSKRIQRLLWPKLWMYFAIMVLFSAAALAMQQYLLGGIEAAVTALAIGVHLLLRQQRHREVNRYARELLRQHPEIGGTDAPFPMMLIRMGDNTIVWVNDAFRDLTSFEEHYLEQPLFQLLPQCSTDWLASGKTESPYDLTIGARRYRVHGMLVRSGGTEDALLGVLYFADLTELYQVRDEYIRSRPVVGIILVDNYDEMTKNLTEGAISSLNARINNVITSWTEPYHGLLRALERNRFLLLFEKRDLNRAIENKFSILEQIHKVESPSGLHASISFGMGLEGASFEEDYNFASLSVEMALSRGGDQAVIKDRLNFTFYGGRSKEADNRSMVRSRITAGSMMELFSQSSSIFVMGHANADMDAVGAAMGICCMARKAGKRAYIVLDLAHNMSEKLIAQIRAVPEYKEVFISGQDALLMCDSRSTLVVVDTNRPAQVEYRPLLESISKVCVVDHHRRAADFIDPVVVTLHEPYASSASELVTELLQYSVEKSDVLPIEAISLLAGIVLDTKSFHIRTGEKTFEAAAVLRQWGADPVDVKRLLQNDFQDTVAKYQIIKSARLYRQEIAISALNAPTTRVLASQAADELLNISGITASFVLFPDGDFVYISARSIGSANVQLILEPLGGGGNAAGAGAQIVHSNVKDVLDRLVASIDEFYDSKGTTSSGEEIK